MKISITIFINLAFITLALAQQIALPLEKNNDQKVTSYAELTTFIQLLDESSDMLKVETIGKSVQGRNLYAMKYSSSEFGMDESKIKVLFFAQQHGNEQSGKEGALLLAQALMLPENKYLFDKIDLAIIPQMNPDGSEVNNERNANNVDLDCNHLTLSEPETRALHHFFDTYLFDVTLDVQETTAYGADLEKSGYRNNLNEMFGGTTNLNVAEEIRELSNNFIIPYLLKYMSDRNFTATEYYHGRAHETDYFRKSTFDSNNGSQSFGIFNTVSLFQVGMNGKDNDLDNIKHRAEAQMTGMRGMLEFAFKFKDGLLRYVVAERAKLLTSNRDQKVAIQMEHTPNGQKLSIPLFSSATNNDTLLVINDYRPVVKSVYDVQKPAGYLIPKKYKDLMKWADNQALTSIKFKNQKGQQIEQYVIKSLDSIDFEGDMIMDPTVESKLLGHNIMACRYVYIPTSQLKGNMLVIALEPKSMLGLATYKQYTHLLKRGKFPVLRVVKK